MKSGWKTKAPCGNKGTVCRRRRHVQTKRHTRWRTDEDVGTRRRRRKQLSEEAMEAMSKTIERTLS